MKDTTVLIIEDERKLLETLSDFLKLNGYHTYLALDGIEGLRMFREHHDEISCVLIDVMLPFTGGNEVLKQIRLISNIPVIMLTAKEEVEDQIESFSLGADDYIVKPYSLVVVKMHMEAVLKRYRQDVEFIESGDIRIETSSQKVFVRGEEVAMTPKEYDTLQLFLKNEGIVLAREKILDSVWGYQYVGDTRTVDTIVKQIRKKLGDPSYIHTVYGTGYRFEGKRNGEET